MTRSKLVQRVERSRRRVITIGSGGPHRFADRGGKGNAWGGGTRSAEFSTLPGFLHDVCSCVYPMAVWSPFFRSLPLKERGLEWIEPAAPLAHILSMTARP